MTRVLLSLRLLLAGVLATLGTLKVEGLVQVALAVGPAPFPVGPYWAAALLELLAAVLLLRRDSYRIGASLVTFGFLGAAAASVLLGVDAQESCRCLGTDPGPRSTAMAVLGGVVVLSSIISWLSASPAPKDGERLRASVG